MVTLARAQRLKLPLAPAVALAGGAAIALAFLVVPASLLERIIVASGIPSVVAAAEPPLGFTARIGLGLVLGGGFAVFAWLGARLLLADGDLTLAGAVAAFRRQDVHPDAPPRPPLFANRDLGTPFLDVKAPAEPEPPVERALPIDLDRPLADYDPAALLDVPLPAPEPVAPLAPPARPSLIDPGDRFETFELTPVARAVPLSLRVPPAHSLRATPLRDATPLPLPSRAAEPVVGPETEATVHDLLARLERGLAPAAGPAAAPATAPARGGIEDTLGNLRRMATAAR